MKKRKIYMAPQTSINRVILDRHLLAASPEQTPDMDAKANPTTWNNVADDQDIWSKGLWEEE